MQPPDYLPLSHASVQWDEDVRAQRDARWRAEDEARAARGQATKRTPSQRPVKAATGPARPRVGERTGEALNVSRGTPPPRDSGGSVPRVAGRARPASPARKPAPKPAPATPERAETVTLHVTEAEADLIVAALHEYDRTQQRRSIT